MAIPQISADLMPLDRNDVLRRHLEVMPDMKSVSAHRWRWTVDGRTADVISEADGAIRIALELPVRAPAESAVAVHDRLPGNLRFAIRGRTPLLVADTLVDGYAHLPASFRQLKAALSIALDGGPKPIEDEPLVREQVAAAIAEVNWPGESVVEQASHWELRPRVRGSATAVQAVIDKAELRIFRELTANVRNESTRNCVCEQALRFNSQFRHARLAVRDGKLLAESRLHAEQLTATWIETAAWAVAVACRHSEDVLCVLADDADLFKTYAQVFLNRNQ